MPLSLLRKTGGVGEAALALGRQSIAFQSQRARGVSVLAVIAIHATAAALIVPGYFHLSTAVLLAVNRLTRFAVPVFVILSGFHLSLNARNERPRSCYRHSLRRLVVPYALYSAIYVAADGTPAGRFLRVWLMSLLDGSAAYHLWFMCLIIELYLLHPFLRRAYRRMENPAWCLAGAMVVQCASVLLTGLAGDSVWSGNWLLELGDAVLSPMRYVGYLVFGYFLADRADRATEVMERRYAHAVAWGVWGGSAALLALYMAVFMARGLSVSAVPHGAMVSDLLALPMGLAALAALSSARVMGPVTGVAARLVNAMGLYAYGVYYIHPLVLRELDHLLIGHAGLAPTGLVFSVLVFVLGCGVCVVAVKLMARLPFSRYLL